MRKMLVLIVWVLTCAGRDHLGGQVRTASQRSDDEAWRGSIQEVADSLRTRAVSIRGATRSRDWKPARTPWGDPDITGVYTNTDEHFTPFERPAEFEGRRLEDITPEELGRIQDARRDATIARLASETPRDPGTLAWYEAWNAKNSRGWLVVDPPDGRIPPLTPEGQRRTNALAEIQARRAVAADSSDGLNLYTRCISRGVPGSMMPEFYGNAYQIHQSPGYVAIRYEQIHETRVIPLDARPHVGRAIQTYMGDARGRWDGDTLALETTNFRDEIAYRGADGASLRVTERFTPIGPKTMQWSVTVDDPSTWVRPWTFAMNVTKTDQSQQPYEYACHEGNYSLRNILGAARAAEAEGR